MHKFSKWILGLFVVAVVSGALLTLDRGNSRATAAPAAGRGSLAKLRRPLELLARGGQTLVLHRRQALVLQQRHELGCVSVRQAVRLERLSPRRLPPARPGSESRGADAQRLASLARSAGRSLWGGLGVAQIPTMAMVSIVRHDGRALACSSDLLRLIYGFAGGVQYADRRARFLLVP